MAEQNKYNPLIIGAAAVIALGASLWAGIGTLGALAIGVLSVLGAALVTTLMGGGNIGDMVSNLSQAIYTGGQKLGGAAGVDIPNQANLGNMVTGGDGIGDEVAGITGLVVAEETLRRGAKKVWSLRPGSPEKSYQQAMDVLKKHKVGKSLTAQDIGVLNEANKNASHLIAQAESRGWRFWRKPAHPGLQEEINTAIRQGQNALDDAAAQARSTAAATKTPAAPAAVAEPVSAAASNVGAPNTLAKSSAPIYVGVETNMAADSVAAGAGTPTTTETVKAYDAASNTTSNTSAATVVETPSEPGLRVKSNVIIDAESGRTATKSAIPAMPENIVIDGVSRTSPIIDAALVRPQLAVATNPPEVPTNIKNPATGMRAGTLLSGAGLGNDVAMVNRAIKEERYDLAALALTDGTINSANLADDAIITLKALKPEQAEKLGQAVAKVLPGLKTISPYFKTVLRGAPIVTIAIDTALEEKGYKGERLLGSSLAAGGGMLAGYGIGAALSTAGAGTATGVGAVGVGAGAVAAGPLGAAIVIGAAGYDMTSSVIAQHKLLDQFNANVETKRHIKGLAAPLGGDLSNINTYDALRKELHARIEKSEEIIANNTSPTVSALKNIVSLGYWGDPTKYNNASLDKRAYESALIELDHLEKEMKQYYIPRMEQLAAVARKEISQGEGAQDQLPSPTTPRVTNPNIIQGSGGLGS